MVSLCRFVCEEEKTQSLSPLIIDLRDRLIPLPSNRYLFFWPQLVVSGYSHFFKIITCPIFCSANIEAALLLWWVCGCRSKCVSGIDDPLTSSWMLCRVKSFIFVTPNVLLFSDAFSKEALIPACSLRSEFADTLVTSRPEDAFIDLIANSILGATMLSMAVKFAFCILSSTASTLLFISLSILSLKHFSRVFTFIAFQLSTELLLKVPTVKSRSLEPSLTTTFSCLALVALPIIIFWSKSTNWLRSLLFDCFFLRVETVFVLITELH